MSNHGAKRIIYSIYTNDLKEHSSAPDDKRSKYEAYKEHLESLQKVYAERCKADYILINTEIRDYVDVNLEKLIALQDFAKEGYDEVCYLDFDVVPNTNKNVFEELDLSKINALSLERSYVGQIRGERLQFLFDNDAFDERNVYVKTCAKNAMLQLEDKDTSPILYNTGVVTAGKEVIKNLSFEERLQECKDTLDEAKEDSLYPEEISKYFCYNNEVFITYIIEKYGVPHHNTGDAWNYILDKRRPGMPDHTVIAHLIHHVNKNFEYSFG